MLTRGMGSDISHLPDALTWFSRRICGTRNRLCFAPIAHQYRYTCLRQILLANPGVCFCHAIAQADRRFPIEILANTRVIAVAAVHAFGRIELVTALQLDA